MAKEKKEKSKKRKSEAAEQPAEAAAAAETPAKEAKPQAVSQLAPIAKPLADDKLTKKARLGARMHLRHALPACVSLKAA